MKNQQCLSLTWILNTILFIVTKIIGKEDVDVAYLISKLGISDWVKQGIQIIIHSEGICPLCQQELPEYFEEKINSYFDDSYEKSVLKLENHSTYLTNYIDESISEIEKFCNENYKNPYIDVEKINSILNLIKSRSKENKLLIEQKIKEPSRIIQLVRISDLIKIINESINDSILKIQQHNKRMTNIKFERQSLSIDLWRYITEQLRDRLNEYSLKIGASDKLLLDINSGILKKKEYENKYETELLQKQQQITSVEHSVVEINRYLSLFGFKNFRLASATEKGNYKIVREDGKDAKDTLSEGEKTFITFLYFYQLLKGSNDISEIMTDKVVVIDDPISILDSSVLFIVSSLVREIMFDIHAGRSEIKQLFVLTHNIYFHKEASFSKGSRSFGEGTYWIVRKDNNISRMKKFSQNPIMTSYELLWSEIRESASLSFVSIQNSMRRILENYFKFFGDINLDVLEDKFDHEGKMVCRSLISWINDGSHFISEDLYVGDGSDLIQKYLIVFRDIFIKNGHAAHYYMMMKGSPEPIGNQFQPYNVGTSLQEVNLGMEEVAASDSLEEAK
ncbi:AAA family ATPase [Paenibacillus rhizoplanae]|uniref:AAA family ATPase n=1 Tax=Paenibacillus rhizoplanae TaxID=1917181 RepID=A0ABW5FEE8_9BACL